MPGRTDLQDRFSQKVAVGVVYVAVMFMSIMDTSIVNVSLPAIARHFRAAATAVDGVSIAFLVSLAVFIPASGWLGDRFGGKRVLMTAVAVFTAASALCGAAGSVGELVAFRVLQGVGGGLLAPVGIAMLFRAFPPAERVRASSIIVVPTALAPALAPVIGGVLVTDASWRWVFYVNVPVGIAAFVFGVLFVANSPESDPGRFDLPGFLLAGAGLGLFMYGVCEGPDLGWGSARVLAAGTAGLVLLAVMVAVELRARQPIVALWLLGNRLLRCTTAGIVTVSVAFFGVLFTVTLYYQEGRGMSALAAGLSQFPTAIGVLAGSQLASRVIYWRVGPRRHLTVALLGVALFAALLALPGAHTSLWWPRLILFCLGFAMAQVLIPSQAASFATVTPADTGRASSLYNAGRQIGSAAGVAVVTTAIVLVGPFHLAGGHETANLAAYRVAFLVAAAFALAGIPATLSIRDTDAARTMVDPRRRHAPSAPAPAAAAE